MFHVFANHAYRFFVVAVLNDNRHQINFLTLALEKDEGFEIEPPGREGSWGRREE